ncbi:Uncharacterized protein BAE44_0002292 [Dichanthelium oligosanthes]|uniref:Uncharacterized protein n=1 Tax=Dichanthelium oligosanthes TaxID=888268 RepID=A0A1E5WH18_9POAL|nr:Uncharacterized protein BAE44_0002292 [Dichanthelium oligosanthes]
MVVASSGGGAPPPKLVTFLGKGGSGKTTAAAVAAQYYASEGFKTCLVTQSQDPATEQLMGCKIGNSLTECAANLSTIKLETSKMLLEPLDRLKKVDAQVNFTQGVLEGVVLALQKLLNFFSSGRSSSQPEFDVVVYDCNNTEEILRLIGATDRARSYLRYVRDLAEKTDMGRLASPSLLKLIYDAARPNGKTSEGRLNWSRALSSLSQNTKEQLRNTSMVYPSVTFDSVQKSVALFMPGFDKSEIKLYQYRGGSELLIEAGDQRRVIKLPPAMQGKVGGAKFVDRNLIVTIR